MILRGYNAGYDVDQSPTLRRNTHDHSRTKTWGISPLKCSALWLAFLDGSLKDVARSLSWFSFYVGSLWEMVLSFTWLAFHVGSLRCMARFVFRFSPFAGSLYLMVL